MNGRNESENELLMTFADAFVLHGRLFSGADSLDDWRCVVSDAFERARAKGAAISSRARLLYWCSFVCPFDLIWFDLKSSGRGYLRAVLGVTRHTEEMRQAAEVSSAVRP